MTHRWLFARVLVVGAMIALPAFAFASPPDESWRGGLWDDDDFDTVILFITGHSQAITAPANGVSTPPPVMVVPAFHRDGESFPIPPLASPDCRAPPIV